MKRYFLWGLALGLILFSFLIFRKVEPIRKDVVSREEQPLPYNFVLSDLEGKEWSLQGLKGKTLLLEFWASWCPVCRRSIPDNIYIYNKYRDKGLVFLAIAIGSRREDVEEIVEAKKIPYPVLMGNQMVASKYSIHGVPTRFLIDPEGKIVKKFIGYQDKRVLESAIEEILPKGGER